MRLSSHAIPGAHGHTSRTGVKGLLAGATALALIGGGASVVMAANPPIGPGNIEIFTKRDMVAIEGYTAQAGQKATITVTRGGSVIGVARGVVDSTGFLEVNHPGGVCWDVVTPNITGLDEVSVDFEDGSGDGANAGTAVITSVESVDGTATPDIAGDVEGEVIVKGTYGADVDTTRMAVEIVNPDMRNMGIGERAIGWPDEEVPAGYTVDGSAAGGEFTVTYGFYSKAEQDAAFAGDPSVASWQAEPVGVEAQLGLTISEYKEIDGPGFGGCPAGPAGQAPYAPAEAFASAAGQNGINVTWSPATVPADAPAITGYEIVATDTDLRQEVSVKVGAAATSATIRGLVNAQAYPVQVYALNGQSSTAAEAGTVIVTSEPTAPEAQAPSAPGNVTVTDGSMLGSADISWSAATANGSAVTGYTVQAKSSDDTVVATTTVGSGTTSASLDGLTQGTQYGFVVTANSAAGNTAAGPVSFTPRTGDETAPSAPTIVRVTAGNGSATVEWQPATAGNTPVTGYVLTATPPTGTPIEAETDAAGRSAVLTGLTNNTTYALTLVATSAAGDSPAATSTVTPADQLTATAQYRSDDDEWRIGGTASVTGDNTITAINANGEQIGTATVLADGSWTLRERDSDVAGTSTITVTSKAGGSITVSVSTR